MANTDGSICYYMHVFKGPGLISRQSCTHVFGRTSGYHRRGRALCEMGEEGTRVGIVTMCDVHVSLGYRRC